MANPDHWVFQNRFLGVTRELYHLSQQNVGGALVSRSCIKQALTHAWCSATYWKTKNLKFWNLFSFLLNFRQRFPGHWNTGAFETWWACSPSRPSAHSRVLCPETAPQHKLVIHSFSWKNSRTVPPQVKEPYQTAHFWQGNHWKEGSGMPNISRFKEFSCHIRVHWNRPFIRHVASWNFIN